MHRFLKFDAIDFLQLSKSFDSWIEKLTEELNAISELTGQSDNIGRGSGISDPTARTAAEREKIKCEISRIERYKAAKEYAFNHMPEQYIDVLNTFFFTNGHIHNKAQAIAEKYGVNYPKGVYRLRREALEEFTRIITERYY